MFKAYKYRIYPNKEQQIQLAKTFGCCRFVYNKILDYRKKQYDNYKINMNKISCNNYCNQVLKKQYEWLKDADKFALTNAIHNMDYAYQKFFKGHNCYPKFKSKRDNKRSYTTNFCNKNIEIINNKIKLPKLKWIKAKISRTFVGKIKSVTVSQTPSGKYFVSVLVDTEHEELPKTDSMIGLDLGLKEFCVDSNGSIYENPRILRKFENKLAKEHRKLAHKQKGSNNRNKQRIKLARIYEKITNIRKDYLHKLSHKIINENQVIVSEDLSISNMMKNHKLAKSISDVSWYEFTRQIQYKSNWNKRTYIKIGTFYPSSQTCSNCGHINPNTKNLSVREWDCPNCLMHHNRDINAAKNILAEGLKLLSA